MTALTAVCADTGTPMLASGRPVAQRGDLTVIADASLYRFEGPETEPAARIAGTIERRGDAAAATLDGDFAYVAWDGRSRRLEAARDFAGRRALFYAEVDGRLHVASTVAALLEDPRVPRTLDLAALATAAAGLWGHSAQTAYAAIRELPAAHRLHWTRGAAATVEPYWCPAARLLPRREDPADAAVRLRGLLEDAVRVRLADRGGTAVSLSGGWDSTAVLGAGIAALGRTAPERLRPVSISYPPGDPGREDEIIREVESHTGIPTRWIEVDSIPLFGDAEANARRRGLPFAHAFEEWNRVLSRTAHAAGCTVMLDGSGGDQLFQVSDIYLSDLFARGRWVELARQWRQRGGRGARNFWRWAVRPALPVPLVAALAHARGLPAPPHHFDRQVPYWFVPRFLERHGVLERERTAMPPLPRHDRVLEETHAYLRFPYFGRISALLHGFARDEGVELRSPLLDSRVVGFAAERPWSDRADGRETKVLLRRAMRGLLPEALLAPRARRTGVTSAYFLRQLRGPGRRLIEAALRAPRLADLGMIDPARLHRAWEHVQANDDAETGVRIFFTVQAELWLRGREAS